MLGCDSWVKGLQKAPAGNKGLAGDKAGFGAAKIILVWEDIAASPPVPTQPTLSWQEKACEAPRL